MDSKNTAIKATIRLLCLKITILPTRQSIINIWSPVQHSLARTQQALRQHCAHQHQCLSAGEKQQLSSGGGAVESEKSCRARDLSVMFSEIGAGQATKVVQSWTGSIGGIILLKPLF